MRTYTLFFVHDVTFTHEFILVLAVITVIVGCVGALAYFDLKQIIIYNIVIAVGIILFGLAQMNEREVNVSIYYFLHDTFIKEALFLLIGNIIRITGTSNLRHMSGLMKTHAGLGWIYIVAAFGLFGIPPLSGFAGKLMIVK